MSRLVKLMNWVTRHRAMMAGFFAVFGVFAASNIALADPVTDAVVSTAMDPFWWLAMGLAFIMQIMGWVIGKLIVLVIGMIIVPVLGYNGFADSNIISIGWPLVRDIVNMFVIVILLVIAVETIMGSGKAQWEKQLPRLFIAMVAVNFSRLLCLLMIDFGQIIMFTFVNAIRDIAAGNFVNLFQINAFLALDVPGMQQVIQSSSGNYGLNSVGYLGTAYATVVFMSMILAVLMMMAFIFIYRIVILWVLVIMSPLAFFMGGVKDLISQGGSVYSDWWKQMTGAITLGPILAFFLWLSLAAASNGPIATSERFPALQTQDSTAVFGAGFATEIFQIDKFTSMIIALVLLTAGFKAASGAAGALGGVAATLINEQAGKKLVSGIATAPFRGARAAAKTAAPYAAAGGIALARQVEGRTNIGRDFGKGVVGLGEAYRQKTKDTALEFTGAAVARTAGRAGGAVQGFVSADKAALDKAAGTRVAGMSDDQKLGLQRQMAALKPGEAPISLDARADFDQTAVDWMKSKDSRKKYKTDLEGKYGKDDPRVSEDMEKMNTMVMNKLTGNEEELIGDDAGKKDAFLKYKTANLHMLSDADQQKVIEDEKFNPANLSANAIGDNAVREKLKESKPSSVYDQETKTWKTVSVWENMELGKGIGKDLKDAMKKILPEEVPNMSQDNLKKSFANSQLELKNISSKQMENPRVSEKVVKAVLDSNISLKIEDIGTEEAKKTLAKNPKMSEAEVTAMYARVDKTQADFREAVGKQLQKDRVGATSDKSRAEIDKKIVEITGDFAKSMGYVTKAMADADPTKSLKENTFQRVENGGRIGAEKSVAVNVKQDITFVNKFPESALGGTTELMKAALQDLNVDDVSKSVAQFHVSDEKGKDEILKAIERLGNSVIPSINGAKTDADRERLTNLAKHIENIKAALVVIPTGGTTTP